MSNNVITFSKKGSPFPKRGRSRRAKYVRNERAWTHTFRSYNLIVESDEADLVRDVCFDMDRAQSKLRRVKTRLKNVQERAAADLELLTTAETKLTAAIVAALLSTASDRN
jgi:hypothetical protein